MLKYTIERFSTDLIMVKHSKLFSLILALLMAFSSVMLPATAFAADATPAKVYTAVKKAYGKKFPLSQNAKNLNPKAFGISKKKYSSYYAKYKGNNKSKYMIFIAKANKMSDARSMKKSLENYLNVESRSMNNYLSANGKKLYKNAKVGSKGKYVYLVMLDTNSNKKAVNAIKKAAK